MKVWLKRSLTTLAFIGQLNKDKKALETAKNLPKDDEFYIASLFHAAK